MKKTKFLTAILVAAMLTATLTACGNETEDNAVTPEEPETVTESGEQGEQPEETDVSENNAAEEATGEFVVDVNDYYKFDLEQAVSLYGEVDGTYGVEITPAEAYERHNINSNQELNDDGRVEGLNYGAIWDFGVFQPPAAKNYNSIDNPGFVDTETFELNVEPIENTIPPFVVREGDVINGQTVQDLEFSYEYYSPAGVGDGLDPSGHFNLDGELVLSGYIIAATMEGNYITPEDILFYPDSESAEKLFFSESLLGVHSGAKLKWCNDFYSYSDIPTFLLGTLQDEEYSNVDLSKIPNDGSAKKVEVTLTDVTVRCSNVRWTITAKIAEIN